MEHAPGAGSLGSCTIPPPPASRCPWPCPAAAAPFRPRQGSGRGYGKGQGCDGAHPFPGLAAQGLSPTPIPGREFHRRRGLSTVGSRLSAPVWAGGPGAGETPGLTSPDSARLGRSSAGRSRTQQHAGLRSLQPCRRDAPWGTALARGCPRVPEARPTLAPSLEEDWEGSFPPNDLPPSFLCLSLMDSSRHPWGQTVTHKLCNFCIV